ncbi:hypothetical protein EMIHUDRAFT_372135, partial [Emiliania huxleyi CCMP1516]|uniref:Uncharacterized protein n=2 Tax=Emiliania huxleyi TaxID=2903 RepID=A0A0D3I8K5_EMIH1
AAGAAFMASILAFDLSASPNLWRGRRACDGRLSSKLKPSEPEPSSLEPSSPKRCRMEPSSSSAATAA